jgi:hypothetical protein
MECQARTVTSAIDGTTAPHAHDATTFAHAERLDRVVTRLTVLVTPL